MIQTWQPWVNSTGPRTAKGKAKASKNAAKGGIRPLLRLIDGLLRKQQQSLDELSAEFYDALADQLITAALDGDIRAIQKMTAVIDE